MRLIIFLLFFLPLTIDANTIYVGPSHSFTSFQELYNANVVADYDTILVEADLYQGDNCLFVWEADNLYIKGINGTPTLDAADKYIWGKGIWVVAGNNTTIENFVFTGAKVPDNNGAGIRLDGGTLTVRHCLFDHNEMGILTNNSDGDITVEYCEFSNNGYGDGFSHNIYVNSVNSFTFRYNYTHHSVIGHTLKSRAKVNIIEYNYFTDGIDGNSSRLIDLPNGGMSIIQGNYLEQGPLAENINFIGYGLEGYYDAAFNHLYVNHNTLVNLKTTNGLFLHIAQGPDFVQVTNNAFLGTGELVDGEINVEQSNFKSISIEEAMLFSDNGMLGYPSISSPLIDQATPQDEVFGHSLTPTNLYIHPMQDQARNSTGLSADIGAYESLIVNNLYESTDSELNIFPNPTSSVVNIKVQESIEQIKIFDVNGQEVFTTMDLNSIELSNLSQGIYVIEVWLTAKSPITRTIIKL